MHRLPLTFIVTGIVAFITLSVITAANSLGWLVISPRSAQGWFYTHLLVLGWGTMLAMGAVYQLIPVVVQRNIYNVKLGFVHYACFMAGIAGLLLGFRSGKPFLIAASACVVLIGFLIFVANVAITLVQARQWSAITIGAGMAVFYLSLTGVTGSVMALNMATPIWRAGHEALFGAHLWLGLAGWFGTLILSFSFKLLPMFYLAHGYPVRLQSVILILWNTSILTGAFSRLLSLPLQTPALMLAATALALYNVHIMQIQRAAHKKNPGFGIRWSVASVRMIGVVVAAAAMCSLFFPAMAQKRMLLFLILAYLLGWIAFTILGYMSKIIPFLWWTHKYGSRIGQSNVPTMVQMLNERHVLIALSCIAASILAILAGAGMQSAVIAAAGTFALSVFSLIYLGFIGLVFTK